MYINIIDHKTFHQKIPPTTLVLKYVCNFSYFMMSIILSQIYFICWSSPMFIGFIFKIDCLKSKSNPIYFKQTKNNLRCDVYTYFKKSNAKMQYLWLQFLGGVVCFYHVINITFVLSIGNWLDTWATDLVSRHVETPFSHTISFFYSF